MTHFARRAYKGCEGLTVGLPTAKFDALEP